MLRAMIYGTEGGMVRYFCSGDTFSKPKAAAYFDEKRKNKLATRIATFKKRRKARKRQHM